MQKNQPVDYECYDARIMPDVLWGPPNAESLEHQSLGEAVEAILDELGAPEDWPPTIEVSEFHRMPINAIQFTWGRFSPLEWLLENIDEEHGHPDKATEPTESMRKAEREFVNAILKEYSNYQCEEYDRLAVDTAEWRILHPKEKARSAIAMEIERDGLDFPASLIAAARCLAEMQSITESWQRHDARTQGKGDAI